MYNYQPNYGYGSYSSSVNSGGVFAILAFVFAIAATVLALIFITPEKRFNGLNKFGKFLHKTLTFKYLIVEKILQCLYIFSTAFVILCGFFMLFNFDAYRINALTYFLACLAIMVLGPIFIRVIYELILMTVLLVKNVISINNKLKNNNDNVSDDPFKAPDMSEFKRAPQNPPAAPNYGAQNNYAPPVNNPVTPDFVCPNCGAQVAAGSAFCTKCGTKFQNQ